MKEEIQTPRTAMPRATNNQGDLFFIDSPLLADFQGERTVAEFPFFALSKNKHLEPMVFESGDVRIEISASKYGIATIYDKEILLYIASLMIDMKERGEEVDRTIRFTAHDLFRVTGTNSSKRSYDYLIDALRRLRGTMIETNIVTGGEREETNFSWLDHFRVVYTEPSRGDRRVKHVELTLCDWLFRAVLRDRRIATYDLGYFSLGPIERRLYELALFNCEEDKPLALSLEQIAALIGCPTNPTRLRAIRKDLVRIAETDILPEYRLTVENEKIATAGRPKLETMVRIHLRPSGKKRRLTHERPPTITMVEAEEAGTELHVVESDVELAN
jgi:hypothetical protein